MDEFENFASEDFAITLAQSRRYTLSLVVAHPAILSGSGPFAGISAALPTKNALDIDINDLTAIFDDPCGLSGDIGEFIADICAEAKEVLEEAILAIETLIGGIETAVAGVDTALSDVASDVNVIDGNVDAVELTVDKIEEIVKKIKDIANDIKNLF